MHYRPSNLSLAAAMGYHGCCCCKAVFNRQRYDVDDTQMIMDDIDNVRLHSDRLEMSLSCGIKILND